MRPIRTLYIRAAPRGACRGARVLAVTPLLPNDPARDRTAARVRPQWPRGPVMQLLLDAISSLANPLHLPCLATIRWRALLAAGEAPHDGPPRRLSSQAPPRAHSSGTSARAPNDFFEWRRAPGLLRRSLDSTASPPRGGADLGYESPIAFPRCSARVRVAADALPRLGPRKIPGMNGTPEGISGIVLAGGQGRRMGGVDKGLEPLRGKPMVQWVLGRLEPQVDEVLINANQNLEAYARFGYRVVTDEVGGFAGPLAGLASGMRLASRPLVVSAPCDSPFLPTDLVARLHALDAGAAVLAVAKTAHSQIRCSRWRAAACSQTRTFRRRTEDRRLVRLAQGRRSAVRRPDRRIQQHQHPQRAGRVREAMSSVQSIVSCLDGYDPEALAVDTAKQAIRACLTPVAEVERVAVRSALGRVLAQRIVPAIDVPAHDNSAMDGYAVRFADLEPDAEATRRKSAPRSPCENSRAKSAPASACACGPAR